MTSLTHPNTVSLRADHPPIDTIMRHLGFVKMKTVQPLEVLARLEFWESNLLIAQRRWREVPERNVTPGLSNWNSDAGLKLPDYKPDCGTLACFGGWVSWMPEFVSMGVIADEENLRRPKVTAELLTGEPMPIFSLAASIRLFGESTIFAPAEFVRRTEHQEVSSRISSQLRAVRSAISAVKKL